MKLDIFYLALNEKEVKAIISLIDFNTIDLERKKNKGIITSKMLDDGQCENSRLRRRFEESFKKVRGCKI